MPTGGMGSFFNPDNPNNFPGIEEGWADSDMGLRNYELGQGDYGWQPPSDWGYGNPWENWGGGQGGDGTDGSGDWGTPWTPWPEGTGGEGDFSLGDIGKWLGKGLGGILDLFPGSDGSNPAAALMIPSWLSAYKQWQDSDKYMDTAREAMKYGDPFGQDNRDMYQEMLAKSYSNPEEVLNDPGHQAMLKSGLDTVSRQDAAKGYLGSGNMMADLSAYTTNLNNQFLSQYRKDLQPLTGAQFDPANAGKFLMQGNQQSIDSQNAALQALMYPFLMNMQQNRQNQPPIVINNSNQGGNVSNQNQGGNQGGLPIGSNFTKWSDYVDSPESAYKLIQALTGGKGGSAEDIFKLLAGNPAAGLDPSTQAIWNDLFGNGAGKPYDDGMGFTGGDDYTVKWPQDVSGGTWGNNPFGPGISNWFDTSSWEEPPIPEWWDLPW
jgi:hypothetical protein